VGRSGEPDNIMKCALAEELILEWDELGCSYWSLPEY
jgi:hypothetical protein